MAEQALCVEGWGWVGAAEVRLRPRPLSLPPPSATTSFPCPRPSAHSEGQVRTTSLLLCAPPAHSALSHSADWSHDSWPRCGMLLKTSREAGQWWHERGKLKLVCPEARSFGSSKTLFTTFN